MRLMIYLGCGFLICLGSACSTVDSRLYYWGDYSHTLYGYTKNPSEKTRQRHKQEILEIIRVSQQKNKQVPPGIYAELGHLYLLQGDKTKAYEYFQFEVNAYPESHQLITFYLQKTGNGNAELSP